MSAVSGQREVTVQRQLGGLEEPAAAVVSRETQEPAHIDKEESKAVVPEK